MLFWKDHPRVHSLFRAHPGNGRAWRARARGPGKSVRSESGGRYHACPRRSSGHAATALVTTWRLTAIPADTDIIPSDWKLKSCCKAISSLCGKNNGSGNYYDLRRVPEARCSLNAPPSLHFTWSLPANPTSANSPPLPTLQGRFTPSPPQAAASAADRRERARLGGDRWALFSRPRSANCRPRGSRFREHSRPMTTQRR